jgi:hypothetical protein
MKKFYLCFLLMVQTKKFRSKMLLQGVIVSGLFLSQQSYSYSPAGTTQTMVNTADLSTNLYVSLVTKAPPPA